MIEARELWKEYVTDRLTLPVLKGVSLTIETGGFVAITGPSGAGKSTLLHLLAGLDTPTRGEVAWDGRSVSSLSDAKRAGFRNRSLGIVFQFYHLLPELSALENVILPGLVHRHRALRELRGQALEYLAHVGLEQRAHHKPSQLSGGELQRVAIARALINNPRVLFCDEPTGNLDSKTGAEIAELLIGLHQQRRISLVLVTHEVELAQRADATIVLRDGQIVDESIPHSQRGAR